MLTVLYAFVHFLSKGSYLYIETSHGHVPGSAAWIYSPILQGDGYLCITFNYHMYGSDTGNLTMYLHQDTGARSIWSATGNHGDIWLDTHVNVHVTDKFQIAMVAEKGGGFRGDIAFDNIVIVRGRCPTVLHCEFDDTSLCDLHNDQYTDDFDWTIAHGNDILSPSTGPRTDHTSGSGRFVYTEASSPRIPGEIARLLTPYLPLNDVGYCVSFWYYMYGQDVAALRLDVRRGDGSNESLWDEHGNKGPTWMKAYVDLPKCDYTLQVIFEAEVGSSYKSDIALDDIMIKEGRCV